MKHVAKKALLGSVAITRKGDDEDPALIVTKALGDFTTEFDKKIGERFKALEEKGVDPELVKRLDKIEAKQNRPGTGDDVTKQQRKLVAEAELKAWVTYLRKGTQTDDLTLKTLIVANDVAAGYLAPPEVSKEIIRDLVLTSPIRQYASVRTSMAPSVKYPRRTGITNAIWEGEVETSLESDPAFGQTEISSRRLTTYVDVSNSLLMGSEGSAEAEVRLALSDDFGQKEGLSFVSGDGIKQPEGILTNASVPYYANGSTTAISLDSMIGILYQLPAYYRSRGVWLMNGATIGKIATIKDLQGRYIWQPSIAAGTPDTILGRPVVEAVDMPTVGSGNFPVIFGDLGTGYRIVDRMQFATLTDPYTQARNGITRIHGTRWVGAGVVQPKAMLKLKMSAS
jgi:HK97 family phage major capsid protein